VTERFTRERRLSARDVTKLDRFTTGVLTSDVVDDVMERLGKQQVRLVGRAGSGKSTTLALAAARVVERDQARVLFLTYHKVLRGELDHLAKAIAGSAIPAGQIVVGTMHDFLINLYLELGGSVPLSADGKPTGTRSQRRGGLYQERGAEALTRDAETLRKLEPGRFDFNYVFIDEGKTGDKPSAISASPLPARADRNSDVSTNSHSAKRAATGRATWISPLGTCER